MTAKLISGKDISEGKKQEIAAEVEKLKQEGITPGLAVILIGDNQASRTYVTNKQKTCLKLGMHSELVEYPESLTEAELLQKIADLNEDEAIHGILVQLPLPDHISEAKVIEAISPDKDVDGFHPVNIGRMMTGQDAFIPCTPFGILEMLKQSGIEIAGKHAVVVGRSNIVGKPVGQLLLNEHATVTYCHSRTVNLEKYTKDADIIIAAVGKAGFIKEKHVKPGAVVIDVGINRNESGKLCGDVAFDEVKEIAGQITPVPGGVGPMTITMLMYNTLKSARNQLEKLHKVNS